MSQAKTHVGLIYGGQSSEHEVSIDSARNVYAALDPDRYHVTPIRIDREGRWHVEAPATSMLRDPEAQSDTGRTLLAPAETGVEVMTNWMSDSGTSVLSPLSFDVMFPVLHGQNGEDGRVQGLLQTIGLPYVGAGVLGSAACMDKEVAKRLLRDAGLPVVPFRVVRRGETMTYDEASVLLGDTLFVKPPNSGSSVGTAKADDDETFERAVADAFLFDNKVLVEQAIVGREIECAVIGNEEPRVAIPGEVVSTAQFYTYEAKYQNEDEARMEVPADLPADLSDRLRNIAAKAYRVLGCEGMARIDFFVTPGYEVFINEVNTIPGFTARSMFPVMWGHTDLPLSALLDTLIQLALDRHERDAQLQTTR